MQNTGIEIFESEANNKEVQQYSKESVFSGSMQAFNDAYKICESLSKSTLVPRDYQNNVANTMIAMEIAQRINASPLAVMQNLHIIHGKPSWSSQFVIAALNSCGRFGSLRFHCEGGKDDALCYAWAISKEDGEKLIGPTVSMAMARAEGWLNKAGSKWKTMPSLMLRYRSAKFFGNLYAPDILMGMHTSDESEDIKVNSKKHVRAERTIVKESENAPIWEMR